MVSALKRNGICHETLIIISAKQGPIPIDCARYTGTTASGTVTISPETIRQNWLPSSESPAGNRIGPPRPTSK
jgi:hypothetical protein